LYQAIQKLSVVLMQTVNPLKGKGVNWLHFAIQIQTTFLILDIWALWCSA